MKALICLFAIGFAVNSKSQDCKNLYYLQAGKTVEITSYSKKGNENGKQVYTISDVIKNNNGATSTINSEMFDKNGKLIAKATNKITCDKGMVMIDMKMFITAQQLKELKTTDVTGSAAYLEYPAEMKVGDKLKDGELNIDYNANGMASNLSMSMTERTVLGKENVSTPAGSWEAFRISYKSKIKMKVAGIGLPINMDVTEWYVPDFGTVKTESRNGSTLITAIK